MSARLQKAAGASSAGPDEPRAIAFRRLLRGRPSECLDEEPFEISKRPVVEPAQAAVMRPTDQHVVVVVVVAKPNAAAGAEHALTGENMH